MSHAQSAQSPSAAPQPPKEESYLSSNNPVSKNQSESQEAQSHTGGLGKEAYSQSQLQYHSETLKTALDKQRDEETHNQSGNSDELKDGGANGDRETEQVKMAPPSEGKVARSVEHTREAARKGQEQPEAHVQSEERGRRYEDLGLGGENVGPGQTQGGFEKKKAQQSSDREQIKEARREGQDVDGGSFGARPHADVGDM